MLDGINIYHSFLVVRGLTQNLILGRDMLSKYKLKVNFDREILAFDFKGLPIILTMYRPEQEQVQQEKEVTSARLEARSNTNLACLTPEALEEKRYRLSEETSTPSSKTQLGDLRVDANPRTRRTKQ